MTDQGQWEEPKIETEKPQARPAMPSTIPDLVKQEDILMEMGRQVVDKINSTKVIGSFMQRIQDLEAAVTPAREGVAMATKRMAELERDLEKLKTSNEQYEENNRKLAEEAQKQRKGRAEVADKLMLMEREKGLIEENMEALQEDLATQVQEIEKLTEEIKKLKARKRTTTRKPAAKKTTTRKAGVKKDVKHTSSQKRS